jgi:hypothetical protein
MATIYEKTAGALIATPGRTVATFPSGLCRVDQKYVCTTATAATHRATLAIGNDMPDGNDAPAIDGLKIYPAPQEIERGDGFTEFMVSAYGRTTDQLVNIELVKTNVTPSFNRDFLSTVSLWEIKGKIAIPYRTNLEYDDLNLDPSLLLPFDAVYYGTDRTVLSTVAGIKIDRFRTLQDGTFGRLIIREYIIKFTVDGVTPSDTWWVYIEDPIFSIVSQQNFGSFVEIDVLTKRGNTQELTTI